MKNIALLDETGKNIPAFLFCYNKQIDFYIIVEGTATIAGVVGDLKAPDGWQDPLLSAQSTYLIRLDIRRATSFDRSAEDIPATVPAPEAAAANGKVFPLSNRPWSPSISAKKLPKFSWPSFLTGLL
jgi:hypothetical protein